MVGFVPSSVVSRWCAVAAAGVIAASTVSGYWLQLASHGTNDTTAAPAALALAVGLLGCLIGWQRPWHRMAVVMGAVGVAFAIAVLASGLLDYGALRGGVPRPVEHVSYAWVWGTGAMVCAWSLVILWFPDGRFVSAGWRRYFVVTTAICVPFVVACYLFTPGGRVYAMFDGIVVPKGIEGPLAVRAWGPVVGHSAPILLVPLISLAGLWQRHVRADPVVRQQVKWLVWGAAFGVVTQIVAVPFNTAAGHVHVIGDVVGAVGQPMLAIAMTIGILRYRLWEIDLVVSRALVFGLVWTALSLVLLVPALAAGLLVGGTSALAAVALALLVTVLFRPTTRRLEKAITRLVYGRHPRPHEVLTTFWSSLRDIADLNELGDLITGTAKSALGLKDAGVWVREPDSRHLRPVGALASHTEVIELSAATEARMRSSPGLVLAGPTPPELSRVWPDGVDAVVPLVAGDELVGVLVASPRRGNPMVAGDFEFLEILGRESSQRLRNLRLEGALRARLAEIEAQATELRRSRQRLVTVQDEERRRIERNLHDGVQQQLVSLAIRLRRMAGRDDAELADLAVEAEQAIFALQEFGRGIFPSVLADQGLAAALRTQVARMPMAVQIDIAPEVVRCRPPRDVEAALYFVALEALTNAQKHARTATAAVCLRIANGSLLLEVVDDGEGFAGGARGSGLSNMADRMAAVGGSLEIDSQLGAGTKVTATVRFDAFADVRPRPQPEADSRR
jgi:signal transduction histidine kinase